MAEAMDTYNSMDNNMNGSFSRIKIGKQFVMDKIWDRKSFEVGGHWPLWRG